MLLISIAVLAIRMVTNKYVGPVSTLSSPTRRCCSCSVLCLVVSIMVGKWD